ncbi:hypothetical protein ACTHTY_11525, partial [Neisseria sp. P0019.S002]
MVLLCVCWWCLLVWGGCWLFFCLWWVWVLFVCLVGLWVGGWGFWGVWCVVGFGVVWGVLGGFSVYWSCEACLSAASAASWTTSDKVGWAWIMRAVSLLLVGGLGVVVFLVVGLLVVGLIVCVFGVWLVLVFVGVLV